VVKQIGVSKIDERNRTYLPESVTKILKIDGGNNWLSWELNEKKQILVFKGHLRFLRTKNNSNRPKEKKEAEVGEES